MTSVTITIDGRTISASPELSILDVARKNGIAIPTLCFHEGLSSHGSCWLCIVEVKGKNRFIPACSTRVADGMEIGTHTAELMEMRRQSLERIINQHCGDCIAPCELSCPAACNIPAFIADIAAGRNRSAIDTIRKTIPLPAILGRICPAPCEDACRRHGVDEPVSVCALKRFAADRNTSAEEPLHLDRKPPTGKRIAIIGAGPAGLSAASNLLQAGHGVTIIDANTEAGGMLRYGIPRFRLPLEVIEADIAPLIRMGARFRFNTVFGKDVDWPTLKQEHDALLLCIGAGKPLSLGIPGEGLPGVVSGISFLHDAACGKAALPGSKVLVIGGGNTAIDAARTALRLGATQVSIMYRRSREEMPANRKEIDEALEEGIDILFLSAPVELLGKPEGIEVRAVAMRLGEPDASGRKRPVTVEGSGFSCFVDTVITALGQAVEAPFIEKLGIGQSGNGTIKAEHETFRTAVPQIFACGDCVTAPDLAVRAVGQGRMAAAAIDRFLSNGTPEHHSPVFNASYGNRDQAPKPFYLRAKKTPRVAVTELSPEERRHSFKEVHPTYTCDEAQREASRCMQCSCHAAEECLLRKLATSFGLAAVSENKAHDDFSITGTEEIRIERAKCVDCGICVRILELKTGDGSCMFSTLIENCPTGAITNPERADKGAEA